MNTKSKLQAFFNSKQDNVQYIEKYEENKDFFNDLLLNGRKEDIEYVIPIKMYKYADPLSSTGNYKKALIILQEIEKDLEKLKGQSKWYNQYLEGVTFLIAVCLGRLKRYNNSNVLFEKLLRKNPTNDNFMDWYKSNKKNEISRLLDRVSIVGVVFYLIALFSNFLGYEIENIIIKDIGLVIALLAFTTSYFWKRIIDKKVIRFEN
jgi:tetratricopeptide (TPR) repeat protein